MAGSYRIRLCFHRCGCRAWAGKDIDLGVVTLRLIDGEKLMHELYDDYERNDMFYPTYHSEALRIVGSAVESQPAVDAVPLGPLSEWLAGYAAPPKYAIDAVGGLREMADATKRAKAWEFALTSMERSELFEVRDE